MLAPYVDVLSRPGALAFSAAGLVARLPISMLGLGVVLLVSAQQGSFALAGALSAAFALSAAAVGPLGSRYVDRWGQHRAGPALAIGHVAALVLLVVGVTRGWPVPVLVATSAAAGAAQPNVGSFVRARWALLLSGTPRLRTAFALESVLDEVIFVTGPPLATALALQVAPWAPLAAAALLTVVGMALLAVQRGTEPPPSPRAQHSGRAAIREPGMPAVVVVMVAIGGVFGSFEVVTVAFAQDQGRPAATGVLLAIYALGSLVAGLVFGSLRPGLSLTRQLVAATAFLALVTLPFPTVGSVGVMGVVAGLAGMAVSPVLILASALTERLVPSARLTEGLTWTVSGIAVGLSLSASLSGVLIDTRGPAAGYLVTAGSGVLTLLAALAGQRWLARADRTVPAPHDPAAPRSVDPVPGPEPGTY